MRLRFNPPIPNNEQELRSRAFLRLLVQAGTADAYDREADDRDFNYWIDQEGQGLIDRGIEIRHKGAGALGGLMYIWDRRIGWQATGADAALYGPFAIDGNRPTPNNGPAAGWRTPFYDMNGPVPVPVPGNGDEPPPAQPGDVALIVSRLSILESTVAGLATQQQALLLETGRVLAEAQSLNAQLQRGFRVPLIGDIRPIPAPK
jgi:hypothetical protein